MKHALIATGTALLFASATVFADDMNANHNNNNNYSSSDSYWTRGDLYRANEFSLDAFGTDSLGHHDIDHISGHRISHDSRLGAGLGANYFILKYVGIGAEAYSENTSHSFVDDVDASVIGRLPIGNTGLAPYVFGGVGHKFDPVDGNYWDAGVGLEYRFAPHIGIFVDARYVDAHRVRDYGLGRAGVRFAF